MDFRWNKITWTAFTLPKFPKNVGIGFWIECFVPFSELLDDIPFLYFCFGCILIPMLRMSATSNTLGCVVNPWSLKFLEGYLWYQPVFLLWLWDVWISLFQKGKQYIYSERSSALCSAIVVVQSMVERGTHLKGESGRETKLKIGLFSLMLVMSKNTKLSFDKNENYTVVLDTRQRQWQSSQISKTTKTAT